MSDPGLSHRLRQRSRRAGLMIGFSMLLTIALCAAGFTIIYSALDGFTSDFISQNDDPPAEAPQVQQESGGQQAVAEQEEPAEDNNQDAPPDDTSEEEPAPTPTSVPEDDEREDDDGGFNPDYQLRGVTVNLRSGPSTSTSIVTALPPSTPLQYMNEDEPTDNPGDGDRWMRFTTQDGLEGWIREIDVTEYEP